MIQTDAQSLEPTMSHSPQTAILVIGGAEDKVHGREILQTFFNRSGGRDAQIAIIPSASREPAAIGNRYRDIFEDMGAKAVRILDIRERYQGEDPIWQNDLEDCTGVFMTGGDQLRLCSLLADTPPNGENPPASATGRNCLSRNQRRCRRDGISHDCWGREW